MSSMFPTTVIREVRDVPQIRIISPWNSTKQCHSWKANRSSASQQILCILQNLKVLYGIHNGQLTVPILNQINPVHVPYPTSWTYIVIQSSHLCLGLPSECCPSGLTIKILYGPPFYPTRAPYSTHLILHYLITRIIFAKECRSHRSKLSNFLRAPIIFSLPNQNIFLSSLFSNTLSLSSTLIVKDQVSHQSPMQNKWKNYSSLFTSCFKKYYFTEQLKG